MLVGGSERENLRRLQAFNTGPQPEARRPAPRIAAVTLGNRSLSTE
jgi:hypothetical protein